MLPWLSNSCQPSLQLRGNLAQSLEKSEEISPSELPASLSMQSLDRPEQRHSTQRARTLPSVGKKPSGQRLQSRPMEPPVQAHCPLTRSQMSDSLPVGSHWQGEQPSDVRLKKPSLQRSQVRPYTPAGQAHWLVEALQLGERANSEQLHGVQPSDVRLKKPERQSLHVLPPAPG